MLSSVLSQTYQKWCLIISDASREPAINFEPVERLLCVFNLSAEATAFPLPDGWNVIEGVNGWCEKTGALPGYAGFIAERG